jgi:ligand-binding SRPBCC domain-containing protein
MPRFLKRSRISAPAEAVFAWHCRPEALEELTPPWEPAEVIERTGGIETPGSRVVLRVGRRPLRITWVAEHTHCEPGRRFVDVQRKGPFSRWEHTHSMVPDGPDASWLEDRIEYVLPLSPLSEWIAGWYVRRKLDRMFTYRHRVTALAFARTSRIR